jgi:hypothetical protein
MATRTTINSDARAALIVQICKALDDLEAQRDRISAEIRELRNTKIKGELDMKLSDFAFVRRLYKLEDNDRTRLFTTLHEGFNALGVGDQLSFMTALDPEAQRLADLAAEDDDKRPGPATLDPEPGRRRRRSATAH